MDNRRTIIVAMDGSVHSEHAFKFYVDNIHRETDNLILVFSVEKPKKIHRIRTQSTSSDSHDFVGRMRSSSLRSSESNREEVDDYVKQTFRQIEEIANRYRVRHLLERVGEPPGECILQAAKQHNANLIITGSRGQGKVRRTILGSVSDYLVHHSQIPILVCKSELEVDKLKH